MPAPTFTVTDASSATINSISYSNVNASTSGAVTPLLFWNNKSGLSAVSDAVQVTITTMTFLGYDGVTNIDTIQNGQEVVSQNVLTVECTSNVPPDPVYTPIGGTTTWAIGDGSQGTGIISGYTGGTYAYVNTVIVAPPGITAGPAQFLVRLNYLYS